jgi:hypothetical protein
LRETTTKNIQGIVSHVLRPFLGEPNDSITRDLLVIEINKYMTHLKNNGEILDYRVNCDPEDARYLHTLRGNVNYRSLLFNEFTELKFELGPENEVAVT